MEAFHRVLSTSATQPQVRFEMLAYLSMMAPRLVQLQRVLKDSGSLYLHCDPTASHYLKILMDGIFGPANFRNEIIWRRTRGHNDAKLTRFGAVHDVLLFYSKTDKRCFNRILFGTGRGQAEDPRLVSTYRRQVISER